MYQRDALALIEKLQTYLDNNEIRGYQTLLDELWVVIDNEAIHDEEVPDDY